MRRMSFVVGCLLGLPPLAVVVDDLAFAPKGGSSATRTFHEVCELQLTSTVHVYDGLEKREQGAIMEVRNERRFVLADRYKKVRGERIEKLARTYQTISSTTQVSSSDKNGGEQEAEVDGGSALEGAMVLFTWDEKTEEYEVVHAKGGKGRDADLLDGLTAHADLRSLVPPAEIEEGDSWDLDPTVLAALFHFGGNLSLVADAGPEVAKAAFPGFFLCLAECGPEFEGDVELTWDGMEETGEGTFAAISLSLDLTATRDGQEAMARFFAALGWDKKSSGGAGTVEFRTAFDGEGTLLWDVARNVAHRLVLEGDIEIDYSTLNTKGGMEYSTTMAFAGTTALTVDVE